MGDHRRLEQQVQLLDGSWVFWHVGHPAAASGAKPCRLPARFHWALVPKRRRIRRNLRLIGALRPSRRHCPHSPSNSGIWLLGGPSGSLLSRRRSRVRVPSLPLVEVPASEALLGSLSAAVSSSLPELKSAFLPIR